MRLLTCLDVAGFWDEQSRVMSHLRHRRTLLDSDAAAPIENAPHRTTLSPGFDQTHEEGDQLAGSEEELLHTSSSISNVGRGWSRPKRAPPALVFRKGDMNMLSMAKQPRKLSEWEWVGVETMQALPVEAQEAVRSAQGRQSAILGYVMSHQTQNENDLVWLPRWQTDAHL